MRAALIVLALTGAAVASPSQEFKSAQQAFRNGDCPSAMRILFELTDPPKLADPSELEEAYALLGACRVDTGDLEGGRAEFEHVLFLDPTRQLDSLVFSKGAIRVFDQTKSDISARIARDLELKRAQEERDKLAARLANLQVYEQHSIGVAFLPFGAGQFQNKDRGKGIAFAAGQGLTLSVSFGVWYYLVNKYGINCHCVAQSDAGTVRDLQELEIAAGITFLVLYGGSVVDALRHYEPQTLIKGDPNLDRQPPPKKAAAKTSFWRRAHLVPMASPTGAGIGLSWEN
jgi:hypothetical protein